MATLKRARRTSGNEGRNRHQDLDVDGELTVGGPLTLDDGISFAGDGITPDGGTVTVTGDLIVTGDTSTATLQASGVADLPTLTPTGGTTAHTGDFDVIGALSATGVADLPTLTPTGGLQTINGNILALAPAGMNHRFRAGEGTLGVWNTFARLDNTGNRVAFGVVGASTPMITGLNQAETDYSLLHLGNSANKMTLVQVNADAITLNGATTVPSGFALNTNTINETTGGAGVTVDGVVMLDNDVVADEVRTDSILEKTPAAGVTIDGVLVKDTSISFDGGTNALSTFIDTTTETLEFSGPCTSASHDVHLVRIGPIVHMTFDAATLAGNNVSSVINVATGGGGGFGANFRPAAEQHVGFVVEPGDGTVDMGSVKININGTMEIYRKVQSDPFQTAGSIVWLAQTVTWNVVAA